MLNLKNRKKVIAGIIIKNATILIAQRGKKDELYNKWEFPGGKMEAAETEQECLKRELFEEFGIAAQIGSYLCSTYFEHKGIPMELLAFYVDSFTGEFTLYEHQQIKWVEKHELLSYDFPEPDKPIIAELLKN